MVDMVVSGHRLEVVLSGAITVDSIRPIRQCSLMLLDGVDTYFIRASDVTRMDAGGAQLLHAFVNELADRGATVRWVAASRSLIAAARALGMEARLGLSHAIPP